MHRALLELTVHGLETSRDFHLRVMEDEEFRAGAIEIQWLERRLPQLTGSIASDDRVQAAAIAAALLAHRDRTGRVGVAASNGQPPTAPDSAPPPSNEWKLTARREGVSDRW